MATLADFVAQAETAIDAISGGIRARMSQDYGDEVSEFTALGTTLYQIQATQRNVDVPDSASSKMIVDAEIVVHHALASISGEQAYRDGQMATDQLALLQESFWAGLASVYEVDTDFPAIQQVPERVGKRITYSVGVRVALT